jgi:hypothetical protein
MVPCALGVKLTEQLDVGPETTRPHELALSTPPPALVKAIVPVGVACVPTSVSATMAVQVTCVFADTGEGAHDREVAVALVVAVREKVFELPVWSVSPP